MKAYSAYLFDMDGTVTQTFEMWLPIVQDTLQHYGIQASTDKIVKKVFGNSHEGLQQLGVPTGDIETVHSQWRKKAAERIPHISLYSGVKEVLAYLKHSGKQTALITASARPVVSQILTAHQLDSLFDVVITGDEITAQKPDPESLHTALGQLGVDPADALMLGDSEKDLGAAYNANVDSLLYFPQEHAGYHSLQELQQYEPTYTIHDWHELLIGKNIT